MRQYHVPVAGRPFGRMHYGNTIGGIGVYLIKLLRQYPEGLTKKQIRSNNTFESLDRLVEMGLAVRHKDNRHTLTEAGMNLDIVEGYDTLEGCDAFWKTWRESNPDAPRQAGEPHSALALAPSSKSSASGG